VPLMHNPYDLFLGGLTGRQFDPRFSGIGVLWNGSGGRPRTRNRGISRDNNGSSFRRLYGGWPDVTIYGEYFGVWPIKCRQGSKTNKSNCSLWMKLTFDWVVDNPSHDFI
jgi:hypothetical protein